MLVQENIQGVQVSIKIIGNEKQYDIRTLPDENGFTVIIRPLRKEDLPNDYTLHVNRTTNGRFSCKTEHGEKIGNPGKTLTVPDTNGTTWTVILPKKS
jgi:hypothetical protein